VGLISAWLRRVCGDLTAAFDFTSPVYGLPRLPRTGGLIPEVGYDPLPGDNTRPGQEPGTKPARRPPGGRPAQRHGLTRVIVLGGSRRALANSARDAEIIWVEDFEEAAPLIKNLPDELGGGHAGSPPREEEA
jgi:hypothetical protein